jgi:hypothetical protein
VTALTVTNGQGTLNFTKVSTDTWTLSDLAEGEIFNQNNLTTLLTRASGFNMVQPLGTEVQPAYGMENPAATMTVEWQNAEGAAQSTTLTVGAQPLESGNYAVKSSDSAYYVEAAEFSVENLINRGRSDYLQEPEVSDTPALDGTTGITATNFISGFETVTETTVLTATGALTSTETVTP